MADSLQGGDTFSLGEDSRNEIAALRSELQQLRGEIAQLRSDVAAAPGKIRLQGGGNVTVSGGNGNWTITGAGPTGGTGSVVFDCDADPPTGIVTLVLS